MKRHDILLAGALTLVAGAGIAGMNPDPATSIWGLPITWNTTNTQGYGNTPARGNGGSSMCVECHTVNPSAFIRDVESNGALVVTRTNALHRGSHYVMNNTAANFLGNQTNSGGGFAGGATVARNNGEYFRGGAWNSTALSKFGVNNLLSSVREGVAPYAAASAEMICESCHNIVINVVNGAGTPDNDLLVGVYQDNVQDEICTGCHGQSEAGAGRQNFHTNDNLPAFGGGRKRHHVMTGDTLDTANYRNGSDSIMWAPSASNRLNNGWCATPYDRAITADPADSFNIEAGPVPMLFRDACNVAGQGSRAPGAAQTLGDIRVAADNLINCSNCHRPHNAMANSGAFILRYGDTTKTHVFTNDADVPNVGGMGVVPADLAFGIRRQSDVDTSYATKIFTDYRALCAGCHYGY